MAERVYQDIVVVPVFNLKQVLDQGISRQTLNEIGHRVLPFSAENLSIDTFERLLLGLLFEKADSPGIVHKLY